MVLFKIPVEYLPGGLIKTNPPEDARSVQIHSPEGAPEGFVLTNPPDMLATLTNVGQMICHSTQRQMPRLKTALTMVVGFAS